MLKRFTDHPASVNETYLQHMGMAFGFGGRMLVGALACLVPSLSATGIDPTLTLRKE